MAVIFLLVLSPGEDQMLLNVMDLLSNEKYVWSIWKGNVRNINHAKKDGFGFALSDGDGLGANDRGLLRTLYQDAKTEYVAYQERVRHQSTGF